MGDEATTTVQNTSVQVAFACPKCEGQNRETVEAAVSALPCRHCEWTRPLTADALQPGEPGGCLVCGCDDLWRQTDFPPMLGVALVGLGALLSTIAWSMYQPVWAIGILMGFALVDLLLFAFMPDVLVCYRCNARHRSNALTADHPKFDLEIHERYRQEAIRLAEHEAATKTG